MSEVIAKAKWGADTVFPCDALKHVSAEDPFRGKLVMGHKSIQQTRHCGFDVTLVMEYHGISVQNEIWRLNI